MKKGDLVVCIDNVGDFEHCRYLIIGKIYSVISVNDVDIGYKDRGIGVINDSNELVVYFSKRFISLKKYRKQKLLKLNESCL